MYRNQIVSCLRILLIVVASLTLFWFLLKPKVAVGYPVFPTVELAHQASFIEGGYSTSGVKAQLGLDWLAHSPTRNVFVTLSPQYYQLNQEGSQGEGSIKYEQSAFGLSLGLQTRLTDRLRIQGKLSFFQNSNGTVTVSDLENQVDSMKEVAHSWFVILPYSTTYRVGLGVQWSNRQVELKQPSSIQSFTMNSVAYTLHNSWRI